MIEEDYGRRWSGSPLTLLGVLLKSLVQAARELRGLRIVRIARGPSTTPSLPDEVLEEFSDFCASRYRAACEGHEHRVDLGLGNPETTARLVEFAKAGNRLDFEWLARSAGVVSATELDSMWAGACQRVHAPTPGMATPYGSGGSPDFAVFRQRVDAELEGAVWRGRPLRERAVVTLETANVRQAVEVHDSHTLRFIILCWRGLQRATEQGLEMRDAIRGALNIALNSPVGRRWISVEELVSHHHGDRRPWAAGLPAPASAGDAQG